MEKSNFRFLPKASRICVIGGGISGITAASDLSSEFSVDIFEKSSDAFGFLRTAVAPDHINTKKIQKNLQNKLENPNINLFLNAELNRNIFISDLEKIYDLIILSCGASKSRKLSIPGSEHPAVISALSLAKWYNNYDDDNLTQKLLNINLNGKEELKGLIFGIGNVALDITRVLLTNPKFILTKEISNVLDQINVKKFEIIGRKDWIDCKFSVLELKELMNKIHVVVDPLNFNDFSNLILNRQQLKIKGCLQKAAENFNSPKDKQVTLKFLQTPEKIVEKNANKLSYVEINKQENKKEKVSCDFCVYSFGVEAEDLGILGKIDSKGKIISDFYNVPIFVCGWMTGSFYGNILTTINNAHLTAQNAKRHVSPYTNKKGRQKFIKKLLLSHGVIGNI